MAKEKNTSTLAGQKLRIRILHHIILTEPDRDLTEEGDKIYLLKEINKKLALRGLNEIGVKTLELDIKAINSGYFEEADHSLPLLEKDKLYDLRFDHTTKRYKYHGHRIPNIPFLERDEFRTLPFLVGILNQYSNIPIVKKLLRESGILFNQNPDEIDTSKSLVAKKPEFFSSYREEHMIVSAIQLTDFIEEKYVIEFEYTTINELGHFNSRDLEITVFRAFPLCIHLHDHLFYLTAVSQQNPGADKKNKLLLRNFRIDQIKMGSIKRLPDPAQPHNYERFKPGQLWAHYDVENQLKKSIGVWNMDTTAVEEEVRIRFYGWAANQLIVFKIHHSQINGPIDKENKCVDVTFKFYTYPKYRAINAKQREFYEEQVNNDFSPQDFPYSDLFHRYPEAAHLLGKYINFMQVLK